MIAEKFLFMSEWICLLPIPVHLERRESVGTPYEKAFLSLEPWCVVGGVEAEGVEDYRGRWPTRQASVWAWDGLGQNRLAEPDLRLASCKTVVTASWKRGTKSLMDCDE